MTNETLEQFERRAMAARITMTALCKRAGVATSTITRMRKGATPWPRTLKALDYAMEDIEIERAAERGVSA